MEGQQLEFLVVRYVPNLLRGEFINIGIILHQVGAASGDAVVRFTRDWHRVLCLDPEADIEMLEALEVDIREQFTEGAEQASSLIEAFQQQLSNSVQISQPSAMLAESLERGVERLMAMYVDAPRTVARISEAG